MRNEHRTRALPGVVALICFVASFTLVSPGPAVASGYRMSDAEARNLLKANGIGIYSSGNCTNRYNETCTSFEQIWSGTINGVINFKKGTGCAVTVTGGTETGHSGGTYSHWNGYKVDISRTTCVTNYIKTYFTYAGKRGDGAPLYKNSRGDVYADEYWLNHWDILYY